MKQLELNNQKLQNENDSLINQNFILQTEIGRHEIGHEIFKERNPLGSKQLETIISNETE